MKIFYSIIIWIIGAYSTYTVLGGALKWNSEVFTIVISASLICFFLSIIAQKIFIGPHNRILFSVGGSYISYIVILHIDAYIDGVWTLGSTLPWFGPILIGGIPALFPLTFLTWLSVFLFFNKKKTSTEPTA